MARWTPEQQAAYYLDWDLDPDDLKPAVQEIYARLKAEREAAGPRPRMVPSLEPEGRTPPEVREKTAIFGQNYGQAGAIDLYGPRYGLPKAISAHQNYFYWGPRGYTGESMIILDDHPEVLARLFEHVQKVARVEHPYSMPYQHFDVYYCTGPKISLQDLWPRIKKWG